MEQAVVAEAVDDQGVPLGKVKIAYVLTIDIVFLPNGIAASVIDGTACTQFAAYGVGHRLCPHIMDDATLGIVGYVLHRSLVVVEVCREGLVGIVRVGGSGISPVNAVVHVGGAAHVGHQPRDGLVALVGIGCTCHLAPLIGVL